MGVLSGLEPKSVFHYFEEISNIPHGSGNVGQISDYLADFARERNLFYIQDPWKNVIIVKDATHGYEEEPAIILQGHMDMVAVKKPGCAIDLETQGLALGVAGDDIYAKDTSLGGDDGIAVAYALAVLDADNLRHPRLEVVLTVDEETGMGGAREIDLSMLQGRRMLNLDSEKEGVFLASCAGGVRIKCRLPLRQRAMEGVLCEIEILGLQGGHSGDEIHKERGNANALLGRLLYALSEQISFGLVSAEGGLADNAIPRQSRAVLAVEEKDADLIQELVAGMEAQIKDELAVKDPGVGIRMTMPGNHPADAVSRNADASILCATAQDSKRAAAFLAALPNGVQAMSADVAGLVETSLNLGILHYQAASSAEICASFSVRSSIGSAKAALADKLKALTLLAGGSFEAAADYPGWKYRADSPLREKMITLYEEMFGRKPEVKAIHAGLECGILGSKIKDLDMISLGPDIQNIHTTEETMSIASTARVWAYLVRLLEEKKDI